MIFLLLLTFGNKFQQALTIAFRWLGGNKAPIRLLAVAEAAGPAIPFSAMLSEALCFEWLVGYWPKSFSKE